MNRYSLEDIQRPKAEDGHIFGFKVPKWAQTTASFVPFLGSAMDVYDAYQDPTAGNIANAILSVGLDALGLGAARALNKGYKAAKVMRNSLKSTQGEVQRLNSLVKNTKGMITSMEKNGVSKNIINRQYDKLRTAKQDLIHANAQLNREQIAVSKWPQNDLTYYLMKEYSLLPITGIDVATTAMTN